MYTLEASVSVWRVVLAAAWNPAVQLTSITLLKESQWKEGKEEGREEGKSGDYFERWPETSCGRVDMSCSGRKNKFVSCFSCFSLLSSQDHNYALVVFRSSIISDNTDSFWTLPTPQRTKLIFPIDSRPAPLLVGIHLTINRTWNNKNEMISNFYYYQYLNTQTCKTNLYMATRFWHIMKSCGLI